MRRRDAIALLGTAAAWPLVAHAQGTGVKRVGVLMSTSESDPEAQSRIQGFRFGLRDLDWFEGRNIHIEYRFSAGDPARIKEQAKELVSLAPDVIVGNGTPMVAALRQATTSIPIVFSMLNDPMGQGFVSSMSRPGGNITGFSFIDFPIIGKWVGLLKDVSPNLSQVAVMFEIPRLTTTYICVRSNVSRGQSALTLMRHPSATTRKSNRPLPGSERAAA